jgi:FkbM family methyltransferase
VIRSESFATVVFADEIVEHPELAAAYGRSFSGEDNATLVVYAPNLDPLSFAARVEPVIESAGLADADVMSVAYPGPEIGETLAANAHAVLTREPLAGPFAAVPAFDDNSVAELRDLAERTWNPPAPVNPAQAFYAQFVSPGDLVFDIGANLGNRTETFLALGARVVAVEPQAEIAQHLRARWAGNPDLTVLECALSDRAGSAELRVSNAHTLSTLETGWIDAITTSGRFAEYSWDQTRTVQTRTLASLIDEFGEPAFCKIDVEGFEATVLAGLDRPVKACSLEFASERIPALGRCLDRLTALGPVECNYSEGEALTMAQDDWIGAAELTAVVAKLPDELAWGDVYIRSR